MQSTLPNIVSWSETEDLSDWMERVTTEASQKLEADAVSNANIDSEETGKLDTNTAKAFLDTGNKVSKVRGIMRKVFDRADTNRSDTLSHDEVCVALLCTCLRHCAKTDIYCCAGHTLFESTGME